MHIPFRYLPSFLFAAAAGGFLACAPARAAELGEIRIASYIGQPLAADIELAMVEDANQAVGARLADPEVYRGAGIAMPPVLSTLHLSTMRRDGRQFVHVTSLRPVDGDHLHLYLELVDHGQRSVRLATLWLTPDPNPAPAALPVAAPPVVAPVSAKGPVVPVTFEDEPAAPARDKPATPHPAAPPTVQHASLAATAPVAPMPAALIAAMPARLHAAPAQACAQPSQEAQACAALGVKNAELRTQLDRLERTVKGLQTSLGVEAVSQPPHEAAHAPDRDVVHEAAHEVAHEAAAEPAAPRSIHAIKPLVPRKPPQAPVAEEGLPWGVIGAVAGGLAAVGAGVAVWRRRRGVSATATEAGVEPVLE